jgi:hypothetical protein
MSVCCSFQHLGVGKESQLSSDEHVVFMRFWLRERFAADSWMHLDSTTSE